MFPSEAPRRLPLNTLRLIAVAACLLSITAGLSAIQTLSTITADPMSGILRLRVLDMLKVMSGLGSIRCLRFILLVENGDGDGDDVHEKKHTKHGWPTGNAVSEVCI
jgi:hypothetical protein